MIDLKWIAIEKKIIRLDLVRKLSFKCSHFSYQFLVLDLKNWTESIDLNNKNYPKTCK